MSMCHTRSQGLSPRQRRGAVVVLVAISLFLLLGMAAMAIDIGSMYVVRTELQAAADSAALAATAVLLDEDNADPVAAARAAANEYARLNSVNHSYSGLNPEDIEIGRALPNADGKLQFVSGQAPYDSVRITVRRSGEGEGGALQLGFANIFGYSSKDMSAKAAANLIPRDMAVVIDLSASMNDDSELYHSRTFTGEVGGGSPRTGVQVNLRDVWCALDGPSPEFPYEPGAENTTQYAGDVGPTLGMMTQWGSPILPEAYNAATDPGMFYIPRGATSTDSKVVANLTALGYSADERTILLGSGSEANAAHRQNRVGVCLGLASWKSGRPGGHAGGDGDSVVESNEITWLAYPAFRVNWSWQNFIDYVDSNSRAVQTDSAIRYRFGLKTFTNFLLESRPSYSQTNNLWKTPEMPLQAVKDAVQTMTNVILAANSPDKLSLEIFATSSRHEVDLTRNIQMVPTRLYARQAGHYDSTTNIGGGLSAAIAELASRRARPAAQKVILLMSDGKPNIDEGGTYVGPTQSARDYALRQAQRAADLKMVIYTISVGQDSDRPLMQEMAAIAHGEEFYAAGTPDEYTDQLQQIFRTLGGKRPAVLIE